MLLKRLETCTIQGISAELVSFPYSKISVIKKRPKICLRNFWRVTSTRSASTSWRKSLNVATSKSSCKSGTPPDRTGYVIKTTNAFNYFWTRSFFIASFLSVVNSSNIPLAPVPPCPTYVLVDWGVSSVWLDFKHKKSTSAPFQVLISKGL